MSESEAELSESKERRLNMSSTQVSFLLLSGGVGTRSEHNEPKQFFELAGHPMIAYSLMAAATVEEIVEIVINAPPGYEDRTRKIAAQYCNDTPFTVIDGGKTRQDSSWKLAQTARSSTLVLHEAARPFVDANMLKTLITCVDANAGYCQPIAFSMCRVAPETGHIVEGVARDTTLNIQLPQKFRRDVFLSAHKCAAANGEKYTEDAVMVVEKTGQLVRALPGDFRNLKITTPLDFTIAKALKRT